MVVCHTVPRVSMKKLKLWTLERSLAFGELFLAQKDAND